MKMLFKYIVIIFAFVSCSENITTESIKYFAIEGKVISARNSSTIYNAKLLIDDKIVYSDTMGFYRVENISEGEYNLTVVSEHYENYVESIYLTNNIIKDIALTPSMQ
jgi:hypothetical protein